MARRMDGGALREARGRPAEGVLGGQAAAWVLQAEGVCFSWDANEVLKGLSLEVVPGQIVCLMGENGCGKSTFIDCVLGSNEPHAGKIAAFGSDIAKLDARERARLFSYVPQMHDRGFAYPVEHVVLMGRTVHQRGLGVPDEGDRALARDALASCGIAHLAARPCTSLSGGEMQMVLLARALVQDTPLILLDEPTAHLDFANELRFLERLESLVSEKGVSVLMATHSPNQAFHLAASGVDTKVALMAEGSVVLFGEPGQVLTPDALRRYFGVEARIMEDERDGLRQIVPVKTIGEGNGR